MIIVGGTYSEICSEPFWSNIFGSGFRAVSLVLENYPSTHITYYTCADRNVADHINYYKSLFGNFVPEITEVFKSPEFHYDHPLRTPMISPRLDLYRGAEIVLEASGDNILAFGLIEASIKISGKKVVYDPQSPVNPKRFSKNGSIAGQLVTVVNLGEASILASTSAISEIKKFFFEEEGCYALIIKMGAEGALLFESSKTDVINIPVFRSDNVWPIGSGDVFSTYFALNWFDGADLMSSAILASKATAIYCNTKSLSISSALHSFSFPQISIKNPNGQVYLAGPFFTFSERWLINEALNSLRGSGLKVFSPFHDVGHGVANDVVAKDLKGLDESEAVFAIIDGLDSGTLFEVGYAVSMGKRVIAYVQNENEESLKMLEGTGCIIERDFTTAIYKTYWTLAEK